VPISAFQIFLDFEVECEEECAHFGVLAYFCRVFLPILPQCAKYDVLRPSQSCDLSFGEKNKSSTRTSDTHPPIQTDRQRQTRSLFRHP